MDRNYSHRTLAQKLGLDKQIHVLVINPPFTFSKYVSENLPEISIDEKPDKKSSTSYAYIHLFTRSQADMKEQFPLLKQHLMKDGMFWVSWPKGNCSIATDLNDNIVRDIGLENELVDVKIASIDENFSGIKFVYRLKDRKYL